MRGVIFTEFSAFVEEVLGLDALEQALNRADLLSGGAYTAVGSYPYSELERILGALLEQQPTLTLDGALYDFGYWLAGRFRTTYAPFFEPHSDPIAFLKSVDGHIHQEVRKLNPDAVPPKVVVERMASDRYRLSYQSHRPLARLARGLTEGSIAAFGGGWSVEDESIGKDGREMSVTLVESRADKPAEEHNG